MTIPTRNRLSFVLIALMFLGTTVLSAIEIRAVTQNLPPFSSLVDGKVVGFSNDLLDLIIKESGNTLNSKEILPFVRAMTETQETPNTILYTVARTPEREALFQWVGPLSKREIYLYKKTSRKDIVVKTLDDARKYRIGVLKESASAKDLIARGFEVDKNLDLALDDIVNMKKFAEDRFDLLVSLDWSAMYNAPNAGLPKTSLTPVLLLDDSLAYYYCLSLSTSPALVKQLNAALEKVKKDGRYAALTRKYLPEIN